MSEIDPNSERRNTEPLIQNLLDAHQNNDAARQAELIRALLDGIVRISEIGKPAHHDASERDTSQDGELPELDKRVLSGHFGRSRLPGATNQLEAALGDNVHELPTAHRALGKTEIAQKNIERREEQLQELKTSLLTLQRLIQDKDQPHTLEKEKEIDAIFAALDHIMTYMLPDILGDLAQENIVRYLSENEKGWSSSKSPVTISYGEHNAQLRVRRHAEKGIDYFVTLEGDATFGKGFNSLALSGRTTEGEQGYRIVRLSNKTDRAKRPASQIRIDAALSAKPTMPEKDVHLLGVAVYKLAEGLYTAHADLFNTHGANPADTLEMA